MYSRLKIYILLIVSFLLIKTLNSQSVFEGHWVGYASIVSEKNKLQHINLQLKIVNENNSFLITSYDTDMSNKAYSVCDYDGYIINNRLLLYGKSIVSKRDKDDLINVLLNYELQIKSNEVIEGKAFVIYDNYVFKDDNFKIRVFLTLKDRVVPKSELYNYSVIQINTMEEFNEVENFLETKLDNINSQLENKNLTKPNTSSLVSKNTTLQKNTVKKNHTKNIVKKYEAKIKNNITKSEEKELNENDLNNDKVSIDTTIQSFDINSSYFINDGLISSMKKIAQTNSELQNIQTLAKEADMVKVGTFMFVDTPIFVFVSSEDCEKDSFAILIKNKIAIPAISFGVTLEGIKIANDNGSKLNFVLFRKTNINKTCRLDFILKTKKMLSQYNVFVNPIQKIPYLFSLYFDKEYN